MAKLSNIVGLVGIFALIYWIVIKMTTDVYRLKIFQEKTSDLFGWSIAGILAMMFGALMINIMFNLSRIADKLDNEEQIKVQVSKKWIFAFLISLPLVVGGLFLGNNVSIKKFEDKVLTISESTVHYYSSNLDDIILSYAFNTEWVNKTDNLITILEHYDTLSLRVSIIFEDEIDEIPVYLIFNRKNGDNGIKCKKDYLLMCSSTTREYIDKVFKENYSQPYFGVEEERRSRSEYGLYIPYEKNGKKAILLFFTYSRWGELGSS
ncbi:MAG: hypothetical protein LBK58_13840 [Prevotellaceae bacterium]|jgi:uncharacterized membrane protein|nr:hypothetical protein [Prevotellaceae bacterium]